MGDGKALASARVGGIRSNGLTMTEVETRALRWQRVKTILADALDRKSPEERTAFLDETCDGDTELRQEIEALLAHAQGPIESCAEETPISFARQDSPSLVGNRIGSYEIVREIGRGGMGAVYLARRADGVFEKEVAIKLLKRGTDTDEVLRRFREERRILARLDHPNIARLLDAGTTEDGLPYFVMEHVSGQPITVHTRDNQLSIAQQLQLFLKVCAAVEAAHAAHVIHRDLKPSNILVRSDGEPKLLDFGIAKLLDLPADVVFVTITQQRRLTPACASPEQARGEKVTPASDVYALGALLYELLTDVAPHRFSSAQPSQEEIARVVCEVEPARPSTIRSELRGDLDNIVLTALRKEPARRYSCVAALREDIRRYLDGRPVRARPNTAAYLTTRFITRHKQTIGALFVGAVAALVLALFYHPKPPSPQPGASASGPSSKSIAVLPFKNLSNDTANGFFVDGMQDQILTDLAQIADLKVVSRTSVMQYRDPARNLKEIGEVLQVAYVLEGAVQKIGSRIQMNAQLVDARNGARVWTENYDRNLADVFAMQTELAEKIVAELKINLSPREQVAIAERTTNNVEAYDWYLRAKGWTDRYRVGKEGELEAEGFLEKAIERDSNFALAYCLLSSVELTLYRWFDHSPARQTKAEDAVKAALRLRPDVAQVRLAEAGYYYGIRDFEKARSALAVAGQMLPNNSDVFVWSSAVDKRQGRWKESLTELERALALDPRNPEILHDLINTYRALRRYSDAERLAENGLATFPEEKLGFLDNKFDIAFALGDTKTCREIIESLPRGYNPGGHTSYIRFHVAFLDRDWEEAERIIDAAKKLAPEGYVVPIPFLYGFMARAQGEQEKARTYFTQARKILEQTLIKRPDDAEPLIWMGLTDAALGRKEDAIREGREAVAREPISRDASTGVEFETSLAQIYAWAGEKDLAIEKLTAVVKIPDGPTLGSLKLSADWDDVRGDPRFAQLLKEAARPIDPISNGEGSASQPLAADNPEKATDDPEARQQFLRARTLIYEFGTGAKYRESLTNAVDLLEKATARDPKFSLGYSLLAEAHLYLYRAFDHTDAHLRAAKEAADIALRLAPESAAAHFAQAVYFYDGQRDLPRAKSEITATLRALPTRVDALEVATKVQSRLGRWKEAIEQGEKAVELDPRDPALIPALVQCYMALRRYADAERVIDRALGVLPPQFAAPLWRRKAAIGLAQGNLKAARAALESSPVNTPMEDYLRLQIAILERDFDGARTIANKIKEPAMEPWILFWRGVIARATGDDVRARETFAAAAKKIESELRERPNDADLLGYLALSTAGADEKDKALQQARHALEVCPIPKDAIDGAKVAAIEAQVHAWLGESDVAVDNLVALTATPSALEYGQLALDPGWDSLRSDPRFARLLEQARHPIDPIPN